jgi:hypothetical protein
MTYTINHDWVQNAADCAAARSWLHPFNSDAYIREFTTFGDLAVMSWRWDNHPIYATH